MRRVTAVTGRPAYDDVQSRSAVVDDLTAKFQCRPEELPARVEALQEQLKKLQDAVEEGRGRRPRRVWSTSCIAKADEVDGAKVDRRRSCPTARATSTVRTQIDRIRQKVRSAFVVFGWTEDDGKVGADRGADGRPGEEGAEGRATS